MIEYGPFDQREDGVMIPGAYFPVPYLWIPLASTPQQALGGTVYGVPCGRVVGGGSVVNAIFFHRSGTEDYSAWDKLGATGWDWNGLLSYFKKVRALLQKLYSSSSGIAILKRAEIYVERDIQSPRCGVCSVT